LGLLVPVLIQVGTLWPSLLERIGNVVGPLVAFGLVSLFLFKSIFMGILLYGQRRVSERLHRFFCLGCRGGHGCDRLLGVGAMVLVASA